VSENYLGRVISSSQGDKLAYDTNVKKILADKNIIAKILKNVVDEFRDYDEETIKQCIEGEPEIGTRHVDEGLTNAFINNKKCNKPVPNSIIGRSTENKIQNEGTRFLWQSKRT